MTNTRIAALLFAVWATLLSLPNHAQIITHWYFGAGLLQSDQDIPDQNFTNPLAGGGTQTTNTVADGDDNGWKLFGGYQFHKNFAVEAAFVNMGKFSRTGTSFFDDAVIVGDTDQAVIDADRDIDIELEPQGITFTGIAMLPLFQGFTVNARGGLMLSSYDARTRNVTRLPEFVLDGETVEAFTVRDSFTETVSGVEFIAGVGFDYRPVSDWSVGFQWERYFDVGDSDIDVEEDIDIVGFTITYHY